MPIDEIDDQIAAYFGWLEDQLDVQMSYQGPTDVPRTARRWPIAVGAMVVAALAIVGVAFVRSSPERAVTVDDAQSTSVVRPTTSIAPDPATTVTATTAPVVEPTTWAPVNLPAGMQLIAVYRGLRDWPFPDSGIAVSEAEPYIGFMVLTADGTQVYLSDAISPEPPEETASIPPQSIDGVGEVHGDTLVTSDGTAFRIGFPISGGRQASDDEIVQIASAFAPVTEADLGRLDEQAQTTLLDLPEIGTIVVGTYELVLRGPDPQHSVALCVRIGASEGCRPDVGNINREIHSRASVASTLVGGRWIVAAYNLRIPALCSARADGSTIAALPMSKTTVGGIEYIAVEVPDGVDFTRSRQPDAEPPTPFSTGVMIRPGFGASG